MHITSTSIEEILAAIEPKRKEDISTLLKLGESITKCTPKAWGNIIGFGRLAYRYPSGQSGEMPILGIANRKQAITVYASYDIEHYPQLKRLGKHSHGKGCLYIQKLSEVDMAVLKELLQVAIDDLLRLPFIKVMEE